MLLRLAPAYFVFVFVHDDMSMPVYPSGGVGVCDAHSIAEVSILLTTFKRDPSQQDKLAIVCRVIIRPNVFLIAIG